MDKMNLTEQQIIYLYEITNDNNFIKINQLVDLPYPPFFYIPKEIDNQLLELSYSDHFKITKALQNHIYKEYIEPMKNMGL